MLGPVNDAAFRFVTDLGITGPDQGKGGKYLFVPPGYSGELPPEGYFMVPSRTNHLVGLYRAFVENGDIAATVRNVKEKARIYPLSAAENPPPSTFSNISGVQLNTVPPNDFSFYDQMLDMSCLLGNVPPRFGWRGGPVDLAQRFQIARGVASTHDCACGGHQGTTAGEMTKWFDTNYHYIVPEFQAGTTFTLSSTKPFDEFAEALALGITTKPVLIGEIQANGQFEIVQQTPSVVGDEWSDYLPDSKDLISDWRKPMSCGNFNVATGKCGGKGS